MLFLDLIENQQQFPWAVKNMAVSSYAKVGGKPWVVDAADDPSEIIIGIGKAEKQKHRLARRQALIGFTTVFKQNGDFVLFKAVAPKVTFDEYEQVLTRLIVETVEEYEGLERMPRRIIFHIYKQTGRREVRAVTSALSTLETDTQYALLHINSTSNFRLFDTSDSSGTPPSGFSVTLGGRQALLLPEGRGVRGRRMIGAPRALHIVMDKESTVDFEEFPSLVGQVYNLAGVNWRGVNARAIPVTIGYSHLIAGMAARLPDRTWSQIAVEATLSRKAWFL